MKSIKVIVITLTLSLVAMVGYTQSFYGAFSLGSNLSQIDGDEIYGFKKLGLNASAAAIYPFHPSWQASVEIQFSQKGSYQKFPVVPVANQTLPYYNLRLDYLEVPFLIHFIDRTGVSIASGIQFGRLVALKEVEWGKETITEVGAGVYARDDWNAILDIRIPLAPRFKLNFRYHYSLVPIRTRTYENAINEWTRQQYNNFMSLRLVYVFNEPIEKE
jgi:hypothetical protein